MEAQPQTDMPDTTLAGAKLRAWRNARKMSAKALGEKLGQLAGCDAVPQVTVFNWELRGKEPRPPLRKALQDLGACDAGDWLEPANNSDFQRHAAPSTGQG